MKLPKRGFNNIFRKEYVVLTTDTVANYVKFGVLSTNISKADLVEAGLLKAGEQVKLIMGKDSENINFKIEVDKASKEAAKYVK